jgi:hypothetical protein
VYVLSLWHIVVITHGTKTTKHRGPACDASMTHWCASMLPRQVKEACQCITLAMQTCAAVTLCHLWPSQ